jgi:hypothetical protein
MLPSDIIGREQFRTKTSALIAPEKNRDTTASLRCSWFRVQFVSGLAFYKKGTPASGALIGSGRLAPTSPVSGVR